MLRPSIYADNFVENIFDDFFRDPFWNTSGVRSVNQMSTDIQDCGDSYQIEMDLPGFAKEDVRAELKNGYLTIRASRTNSNEEKDEKQRYIRKERYSGHYQRSFYVGDAVKQEDIQAKFTDGVLTLQVPKKEKQPEVEESKYIQIQG
ncbi:MAG: Hsp20/alpha crystallin family protein [Lachnospiraceae bacterium]|nr:Hsp20/alpha crystallin family protein [Lachnospiraceae bacterium]